MLQKIKKHFAKLGFTITINQHADFYSPKKKGGWIHVIKWKRGNDGYRLRNLCEYYFSSAQITDGFGTIYVRLSDFRERGWNKTGICKKCGCTQNDGCFDPVTISCWWVKEDLCSACANQKQKNSALSQMKKLL